MSHVDDREVRGIARSSWWCPKVAAAAEFAD
jgi:hypothetical protein